MRQEKEEKVRRVAGLDVVDSEVLPDEKYEWDQVSQEELDEAKWKELGLQDDYDTYEPKLRREARQEGFKHISAKWHPTLGPEGVKMRYVAREFNTGRGGDAGEFFAVTSSSNHGRFIDYIALEQDLVSWTFDCSRAFLHIVEKERITVDAPPEWLSWHRSQGRYLEDYVWRMKKTLYGRRSAPQGWTLWLAELLRTRTGLDQHQGVPSFSDL